MRYILFFLFFLIVSGYTAFTFWENDFYLKALPSHLGVQEILKKQSEGSFRESCGGVIFQLSKSTISAINKEGVTFLNRDLYGRGYQEKNDRERAYYTYNKWTKTPIKLTDGLSPGMHCLLKDDKDMAKKVRFAAQHEGSFYTVKSEAELLLIPELGLLFYAYFG